MITALSLLPPAISARLTSADDRASYACDVERYRAMSDAELLRVTEVCLRNLPRLDSDLTPDGDLQLVLVPELWERLAPRAQNRDRLRRIGSTLAEYSYDPAKPSIWDRMCPDSCKRLHAEAEILRERIADAAGLGTPELVERVRFAIAGAVGARQWSPAEHVYEPGCAYRLVPVVALRALERW